jgi:hypothetical protein
MGLSFLNHDLKVTLLNIGNGIDKPVGAETGGDRAVCCNMIQEHQLISLN